MWSIIQTYFNLKLSVQFVLLTELIGNSTRHELFTPINKDKIHLTVIQINYRQPSQKYHFKINDVHEVVKLGLTLGNSFLI